MKYNILNGSLRLQISTSIKVILERFSLALCFQDIHISKFETLIMQMKVMMYNIRRDTIRWQISDFLPDGNNNVCINPAFIIIIINKHFNVQQCHSALQTKLQIQINPRHG